MMDLRMNFLSHLSDRCKSDPSLHGVVDTENQIFTRYLYTMSGQLVGYQRYNWLAEKAKSNDPKGRYWTYIVKSEKKLPYTLVMMGMETIVYGDTLFLVEGMFEQSTARSYGLNCIATLTNHPKPLRNWLYCYPGRTIALCQDDAAGRKLASLTDFYIQLPKDLDEMSRQEVEELISQRI